MSVCASHLLSCSTCSVVPRCSLGHSLNRGLDLAWPLNVLESVLYRACRVLGIERLRCPASQALIQSMTMYLYNRDSINV